VRRKGETACVDPASLPPRGRVDATWFFQFATCSFQGVQIKRRGTLRVPFDFPRTHRAAHPLRFSDSARGWRHRHDGKADYSNSLWGLFNGIGRARWLALLQPLRWEGGGRHPRSFRLATQDLSSRFWPSNSQRSSCFPSTCGSGGARRFVLASGSCMTVVAFRRSPLAGTAPEHRHCAR